MPARGNAVNLSDRFGRSNRLTVGEALPGKICRLGEASQRFVNHEALSVGVVARILRAAELPCGRGHGQEESKGR
jgi:hypothetical protein